MVLGFALIVFALLAIYSGLRGKTIAETIRGDLGTGKFIFDDVAKTQFDIVPGSHIAGGAGAARDAAGGLSTASLNITGGGAAGVVNAAAQIAAGFGLKTAQGLPLTPENIAKANSTHGPTISGSRSDHQGPPDRAWAADMSNGSSPTKEMDAAAEAIGNAFGKRVNGKSSIVTSWNYNGYRLQLLYRTYTGGNHFNHVHFGARKL
jgi:hypothetical protein